MQITRSAIRPTSDGIGFFKLPTGQQVWETLSKSLMASALRLASLIVLCVIAIPAFAQPAPPTLFTASVAVVPEVAPPGVLRTLIVNGVWPNGCIPKSASLRLQDVGPRQFVVIVLQRPPDSVCTLATERFSFTVSFTPTVQAVQPIIIQTDDGTKGGEGSISTTSAASIFVLTPIISVVPDVDVPNRARTIVISGQALSGCPFADPLLDGPASLLLGGVVIRLDPVPTLVPCNTNITVPYRFEIPYTPTAVGTLRVVAASSSGGIRSESQIRTSATQGRTRAVGNITGAWYDQTTNGSGIQINHNFAGSDVVFATWYLYDNNGKARWLSIQNVTWQAGGTEFTGDLLEAKSGILICDPIACPDTLRPKKFDSMTKVGTVRFRFTGLEPYSDTVPQGVAEAFSLTGVQLFVSSMQRISL
jgi:hypothetical protein